METSSVEVGNVQERKNWKPVEGRAAKRVRAGSSEEEEASPTLKDVTYRLGQILIQLRQNLGKGCTPQ